MKKCILWTMALLLSLSLQNSFGMEARKSKAPHSKTDKAGPKLKKQRNSKENETKLQDDQEELQPFDILPIEIKFYLFEGELRRIIQSNEIFTPWNGVKEFLDTLSLVNKEWKDIAEYLGWNNKLFKEGTVPLYQKIVQDLFVSKEISAQDTNSLEKPLVLLLNIIADEKYLIDVSKNNKSKVFDCLKTFDPIKTEERQVLLDHIKVLYARPLDYKIGLAAQYLIAGANPNLIINDLPLIIFVIVEPKLHCLIPLLLMKGVEIDCKDEDGQTPLMCATYDSKILKMLLDYNDEFIDSLDNNGESALDKATTETNIKSVKHLLVYDANIGNALKLLLNERNADIDMGDKKLHRWLIADTKIAKLLLRYGANIDALPDFSHPIINLGWLKTTQQIQNFKYQNEDSSDEDSTGENSKDE